LLSLSLSVAASCRLVAEAREVGVFEGARAAWLITVGTYGCPWTRLKGQEPQTHGHWSQAGDIVICLLHLGRCCSSRNAWYRLKCLAQGPKNQGLQKKVKNHYSNHRIIPSCHVLADFNETFSGTNARPRIRAWASRRRAKPDLKMAHGTLIGI
jgi:hypothetical protein